MVSGVSLTIPTTPPLLITTPQIHIIYVKIYDLSKIKIIFSLLWHLNKYIL